MIIYNMFFLFLKIKISKQFLKTPYIIILVLFELASGFVNLVFSMCAFS